VQLGETGKQAFDDYQYPFAAMGSQYIAE